MKFPTALTLLLCMLSIQQVHSQNSFWIQTNGPGSGYDVRSFAANSLGHTFAGTWTDGSIWKTTNNGSTWTKCGLVPDPNPVLSLSTNSRDHLFASVYQRGVYRSTDNGATWQSKNTGLTNSSVRANMVDDSGFVWVATEAGLFRSTNNGDSWTLNRPGVFYTVFLDSVHAVVTDDGISIHRSTNHGNTWNTIPRSVNLGLGGVHPDGSYYGSNSASAIFRSTDSGATWTDMQSGVVWSDYTDAFTFNSRGDIFYGRDGFATGILISRDKGQTWNLTNGGLTTLRIVPLFHHPNGFVFVGTNGSGVFRSRYSTDSPDSTRGPGIDVNPGALVFGFVKTDQVDTLSLLISNASLFDTLRIDSITSTNTRFTVSPISAIVAPLSSVSIRVDFTGSGAPRDTGSIRITSNDALVPVYQVPVSARGYGHSHDPIIKEISAVPFSYSQARIVWFRTLDDSAAAADPVTDYSIWRRSSVGGTWEFIETIPAITLDEYAAVVPVPYSYSGASPWNVFMVAARTRNLQIYMSQPDSIRYLASVNSVPGTDGAQIPGEPFLNQNYPNPFNPSTVIRFGLSQSANVSLVVFNTLGQEIATLVQGEQVAGYHEVRFDGSNCSSGVYFYRLKAGTYVETKKFLLVR